MDWESMTRRSKRHSQKEWSEGSKNQKGDQVKGCGKTRKSQNRQEEWSQAWEDGEKKPKSKEGQSDRHRHITLHFRTTLYTLGENRSSHEDRVKKRGRRTHLETFYNLLVVFFCIPRITETDRSTEWHRPTLFIAGGKKENFSRNSGKLESRPSRETSGEGRGKTTSR